MDFIINGIQWKIKYVDYSSPMLLRSDGSRTVGMTDWNTRTVYLCSKLSKGFLQKVLCHELCHCICFSYNIIIPIDQEEFLADWISTHGREVITLLDMILSCEKRQCDTTISS